MNLIKQTILLFIFLLTGVFNKSYASEIAALQDSLESQKIYFNSDIKQYAADSIKLIINQILLIKYYLRTILYKESLIYQEQRENLIGNQSMI